MSHLATTTQRNRSLIPSNLFFILTNNLLTYRTTYMFFMLFLMQIYINQT